MLTKDYDEERIGLKKIMETDWKPGQSFIDKNIGILIRELNSRIDTLNHVKLYAKAVKDKKKIDIEPTEWR